MTLWWLCSKFPGCCEGKGCQNIQENKTKCPHHRTRAKRVPHVQKLEIAAHSRIPCLLRLVDELARCLESRGAGQRDLAVPNDGVPSRSHQTADDEPIHVHQNMGAAVWRASENKHERRQIDSPICPLKYLQSRVLGLGIPFHELFQRVGTLLA